MKIWYNSHLGHSTWYLVRDLLTPPCSLNLLSVRDLLKPPGSLNLVSVRDLLTPPCSLNLVSVRDLLKPPCSLNLTFVRDLLKPPWSLNLVSVRDLLKPPCSLSLLSVRDLLKPPCSLNLVFVRDLLKPPCSLNLTFVRDLLKPPCSLNLTFVRDLLKPPCSLNLLSVRDLLKPPCSLSLLSVRDLLKPPCSLSLLSVRDLLKPPCSLNLLSVRDLLKPPCSLNLVYAKPDMSYFHVTAIGMGKVELRASVPELAWEENGKLIRKNHPTGSLVHCKTIASDHVDTSVEILRLADRERYQSSSRHLESTKQTSLLSFKPLSKEKKGRKKYPIRSPETKALTVPQTVILRLSSGGRPRKSLVRGLQLKTTSMNMRAPQTVGGVTRAIANLENSVKSYVQEGYPRDSNPNLPVTIQPRAHQCGRKMLRPPGHKSCQQEDTDRGYKRRCYVVGVAGRKCTVCCSFLRARIPPQGTKQLIKCHDDPQGLPSSSSSSSTVLPHLAAGSAVIACRWDGHNVCLSNLGLILHASKLSLSYPGALRVLAHLAPVAASPRTTELRPTTASRPSRPKKGGRDRDGTVTDANKVSKKVYKKLVLQDKKILSNLGLILHASKLSLSYPGALRVLAHLAPVAASPRTTELRPTTASRPSRPKKGGRDRDGTVTDANVQNRKLLFSVEWNRTFKHEHETENESNTTQSLPQQSRVRCRGPVCSLLLLNPSKQTLGPRHGVEYLLPPQSARTLLQTGPADHTVQDGSIHPSPLFQQPQDGAQGLTRCYHLHRHTDHHAIRQMRPLSPQHVIFRKMRHFVTLSDG
uniref:(California timema) hypothetical protein n=1 Tax=Timema californicum TaxID=61474 RepID=A0A7R9P777_TIMCA|nr:unnamed protein product [Timema californicum]